MEPDKTAHPFRKDADNYRPGLAGNMMSELSARLYDTTREFYLQGRGGEPSPEIEEKREQAFADYQRAHEGPAFGLMETLDAHGPGGEGSRPRANIRGDSPPDRPTPTPGQSQVLREEVLQPEPTMTERHEALLQQGRAAEGRRIEANFQTGMREATRTDDRTASNEDVRAEFTEQLKGKDLYTKADAAFAVGPHQASREYQPAPTGAKAVFANLAPIPPWHETNGANEAPEAASQPRSGAEATAAEPIRHEDDAAKLREIMSQRTHRPAPTPELPGLAAEKGQDNELTTYGPVKRPDPLPELDGNEPR